MGGEGRTRAQAVTRFRIRASNRIVSIIAGRCPCQSVALGSFCSTSRRSTRSVGFVRHATAANSGKPAAGSADGFVCRVSNAPWDAL